MKPATRVILLGASNTEAGFPVSMVQRGVPHAVVNDMALSGSNLTQIHQAFELALDDL